MSLQDKIHVNTHYTRSVNLERDAGSIEVVSAYIPTSRALRTFARIASTFHGNAAPRAWSLVGPYGSGKSSGTVFLSQLLANPNDVSAKAALKVLAKADQDIANTYKKITKNTDGCLRVLITGAPEPMAVRIVRALAEAAENFWGGRKGKKPKVIQDLNDLCKDKKTTSSAIIEAIVALQLALAKTKCAGIVLVIDELGKFLEYEARHYGANDIYLLQALAEHACKGSQVNLMLFVLLHQTFEQYAKGLSESLKNEWSKVQGRFEEVPFLESAEQVLRVVSAAFQGGFSKIEEQQIQETTHKIVSKLDKLEALPGVMTIEQSTHLFSSCYPLHPVSAILLPMLCQKIAQNERTLFSYLGSHEEFGMQEMLSHLDAGEFIYPHHIYDYFITNQSSALGDYMTHRRWTEVVTAIERLGSAPEEDINLLKTIGILNIIGSKGNFKPSKGLLETCVGSKNKLEKSTANLIEKSVINFRRYSGEYRVWQGSDFDLEEAVLEQLNNLGEFSLVKELNDAKTMLPIVARRYTIENGTLRYFTPSFIDGASFKNAEKKTNDPRILFYLAGGQDDEDLFYKTVSNAFSPLDIIVLCLNGSQLRDAVSETQALRRVGISCQELNGDPIAKREFEDRLTAAEIAEDKLLQDLTDRPQEALWYHKGKQITVRNKRQLQESLSSILKDVYNKAPSIHNELINRDRPSSQAVAARNKLLYGMMHNAKEKDLGIDKFPPEKAIYRSVLRATGLHVQPEIGGEWEFRPPRQDDRSDKYNIRHIWNAIEEFIDSTENKEKSFIELNEKLMAAPYGVKAGLLPIFYVAAYFLNQQEVAIYENRRYRAVFTQEMLERFVKRPDEFTIQRFRINGMRASIFEQYSQVIHGDKKPKTLLELASPLAKFMGGLPEYTQKTKRAISAEAKAVRTAFDLAKSPEKLLFEELPKALGYGAITANESEVDIEGFAQKLTEVLRELRDAYNKLIDKQKEILAQAFNVDARKSLSDLRRILSGNCEGLDNYTVDTKGLRAFIMRINKSGGTDAEWLENILMFLGQKPSKQWLDSDQDTAEYRISDFSKRVIDLEKLRLHAKDRSAKLNGDFDVYLLRTAKKGGEILDDVVAIDGNCEKRISEALAVIQSALSSLVERELMLAALAKATDNFFNDKCRSKEDKPDSKIKEAGKN